MIKKNILFFFLLLINSFCFSQNQVLDSLLTLLKQDKADTNKLIHLNQISQEYNNIGTYDSAVFFANSSLQLIKSELKKNTDLSIKKIIEKYEAASYHNIGLSFYYRGNYPEALKNYFICLKTREKSGDKKGIAASYNNIGLVYSDQDNFIEALKNYNIGLKIYKEIGNKKGIAASYNNIGIINNAQYNYDEALKNHFAALKLREEIGDKKGIAYSYNNIGLVYYTLKNYTETLKYHLLSLKIRTEVNDKAGIAGSYCNIGQAYTLQKKYQQAEEYLKKAEKICLEIGHKEYLRNTYIGLSDLNKLKGNYKNAYENYRLAILYRDSADNEETRKKTIQSQMTYDFEKREAATKAEQLKKDLIASEEKQKQKIITSSVSVGLFLVLLFSLFIFRGYKQKQKANIIITQQKHVVEEQQKEIIDSIKYAKRLQKAILPSDDEIKKYLPNSFVLYKPKDIVAGDFYWMENSDDITFIAAADSTGHGVPGAMVSVVCSNALNRAVNEFKLIETGKILDKTRELVLETFAKSGEEIKDGMDISLISINKKAKKINWSGANNSLLYISKNELIEVKADKQPIGKTDTPKPFITHEISFDNGDIFYLITDGFADQFGGEKGKKFKTANMKNLFVALQQLDLEVQKEKINIEFENWRGNLEQVDDVCVIGVRI